MHSHAQTAGARGARSSVALPLEPDRGITCSHQGAMPFTSLPLDFQVFKCQQQAALGHGNKEGTCEECSAITHTAVASPPGNGLQVLRCVDWGDVREARTAGELIARWAPIALADALELLSPAFSNPEVCAQSLQP